MIKQKALLVSRSALSIESLQIIIVMGFDFFNQHYCRLIITDEIIHTLAALIDCIQTNAQIYFHRQHTDSVYINFIS